MLVPALLVAFAYWITWLIDGILGWQTMTRPIVLGTVIGLLCGDLKTGVIMGASLKLFIWAFPASAALSQPIIVRVRQLAWASRSCPGSPWRRALAICSSDRWLCALA